MPLIVGLGNPGTEYARTPHNVGFEVVDRLAGRGGMRWKKSRSGVAEELVLVGSPRVVYLKPLAYMNRSGGPVGAALRYYEFSAADLFVVCDDVNLPLGRIRIREHGGAGGQKGLVSIIQSLGTNEFARVRIGVGGGEPGADVASHVLSRFRGKSLDLIDEAIEHAADAIECYLQYGLATAMNRYNTGKSGDNPPSVDHKSSDN